MPVHDWTKVPPGIFHDFHHSWIEEIKRALNGGILPAGYYALAEQIAGQLGPDVLTLQSRAGSPLETEGQTGLQTIAATPPRVRYTASTEMANLVRRQSTVVIRHSGGDAIVALVEIVSPGNKGGRSQLHAFLHKATTALAHGYHLLIVDLQPPTSRDLQGIHGALWAEIEDDSYQAPSDKPLTLASYEAADVKTAYIEPIAVGDTLPDMPLFLAAASYVSVPLETTYAAAWQALPGRWQGVLES